MFLIDVVLMINHRVDSIVQRLEVFNAFVILAPSSKLYILKCLNWREYVDEVEEGSH